MLETAIVLGTQRTTVSGVRLLHYGDELDSLTKSKLVEALNLVDEFAPIESTRLNRLVRHVLLGRGVPSSYWETTRTVVIEEALVKHRSAATIAMTIVHEVAHARISVAGIEYSGRERRIENKCVRRQVAFLRALPSLRFPSAETLASDLEGSLDIAWWTDEARIKEQRRAMKRTGETDWIARLYEKYLNRSR